MYSDIKTIKDRVAFLKVKIQEDDRWSIRALLRVNEEQTKEEQCIGATVEHNGVGFTGADGEILSSFAKQIKNGRTMSAKQMVLIHKKMPKYARQLELLVREPDLI